MTRYAEVLAAGLAAVLITACGMTPGPRAALAKRPPAAAKASAPLPASAPEEDADLRFKAALKLMKERQSDEASAAFLALSRDFPAFSGPLTDLGILQAQGRQREQALASLSKAASANPRNAVAQNWLGILYRESGDYVRAEHAYLQALAARPDYAPAHFNLAILYDLALRRPQDALVQYREYQKYAGDGNAMVAVWIKQLEATTGTNLASNAGARP